MWAQPISFFGFLSLVLLAYALGRLLKSSIALSRTLHRSDPMSRKSPSGFNNTNSTLRFSSSNKRMTKNAPRTVRDILNKKE